MPPDVIESVRAALTERDARIAKLKRELSARPVVESEAAKALRAALVGKRVQASTLARHVWLSDEDVTNALRAFGKSAPPQSQLATMLPSDTHALVLRWLDEIADVLGVELPTDATVLSWHARIVAALQSFKSERGSLRAEIERLKSSPARVEREVDRELTAGLMEWRSTMLNGDQAKAEKRLADISYRWLSAPRAAAPAQDEYTKAGMAFAEKVALDGSFFADDEKEAFEALYAARHRGESSAAKVEPAPAEERVTLYAKLYADGKLSPALWSAVDIANESLKRGERWLAIAATVVQEGGAS